MLTARTRRGGSRRMLRSCRSYRSASVGPLGAVTFAVGLAGVGAMHSIHIAAKALLLSVVAAAVGILIAAMLTFAANNVPVALTQAERAYPPEPLALPANLITGTPEQCAVLPDPQQPENTECVRKRDKEYAERLAQWLEEHPNAMPGK